MTAGAKTGITLTNDPTLADGAIYDIAFDVTDAAGNTAVTVTNNNVTYDVSPPTVTAVNGVVSFTNLGIDTAGSGFVLQFDDTADPCVLHFAHSIRLVLWLQRLTYHQFLLFPR